ncbi:hypothetical protein KRP22_013783 [Phytophthora ramorum]|nr:hypothetical protein KRP22_13611 [Phytophthora ramorum]
MTDESAPPPPPPASPPPPLETTIGKYIARFRFEKPQPREARVAAQRSDFWWTKSPRYSPSASPASTWASGGVFRFPEEEEDEVSDAFTEEEEKRSNIREVSDVDSVESKLRRRLGVCSSEEGHELTTSTSVDALQSWGSAEWSSEEFEEEEGEEEEEEGGEDPEEVIARVRKRLGWGATTSTVAATARLKPIELKLSMDQEEKRGRLKPPSSPGSYTRGESLNSFGYSSVERGRFEEASSMGSAEAKEEKEEEEQWVSVTKSEEKIAGSVSSLGESDTQSRRTEPSPLEFTATEPHSSNSSVNYRQESAAREELGDDQIAPVNESCGADVQTEEKDSISCDCKAEGELKEELRFQSEVQEESAAEQVEELPLLPTASPARPEAALESARSSSEGIVSGRSHRSSSSPREEGEKTPTETTKTLDSLVSLVVHSWENDFFLGSPGEEQDPAPVDMCEDSPAKDQNLSGAGDLWDAASASASPSLPPLTRGNSDQASTKGDLHSEIVPSSALLADKPNVSSNETAQMETQEDEEEDCEVPGEEDDHIAQMLLGRIALLEAALRQIDR